MDSTPDNSVLCSRCSRSTATSLYRTCPACREKSRLQRLHRRLLATGGGPTSVSTIQFSPQSAASPQHVQRTLCSHCAQPWQSPRYKTCDRCRRWKQGQRRRRLANIPETLSSMELTAASRDGFSAPSVSHLHRRTRSLPIQRQNHTSQRILQPQTHHDALHQAIGFLCDEYRHHVFASQSFPPDILPSDIRKSVSRYEEETSIATKVSVYSSCGRFVLLADLHYIDDEDPLLLPLNSFLNRCGRHEQSWGVCSSYHGALACAAIPKFSARNLVNVTLCQNYPPPLEDLTLTEEYTIARCHPLGLILKLRPGSCLSSVSHRTLRGHFIVIPQDPGPLLQILPSAELRLDNLIKVFWVGGRPPSDSDLRPYLVIRKTKVLEALQYLVQHNHLYCGLVINQPMMDT
jgi:hypothetical protein